VGVPQAVDGGKQPGGQKPVFRGEKRDANLFWCFQREIEATDRQIDQLVYELYGLTEEEIKIVEDATAK